MDYIPNTVQIGPYTYKVVRVNKLVDTAGAYGICDSEKREISIDADLDKTASMDTFIHECIHAIGDMYLLRLSEQQVSVIATGLAAILTI